MPDAMGHAYLDYLEGRSPSLTIERSDGYLDCDNMESYFCDYSEFPECEKKALESQRGGSSTLARAPAGSHCTSKRGA